jgi:hypothetical protein
MFDACPTVKENVGIVFQATGWTGEVPRLTSAVSLTPSAVGI